VVVVVVADCIVVVLDAGDDPRFGGVGFQK
jgi:hypothetical protein